MVHNKYIKPPNACYTSENYARKDKEQRNDAIGLSRSN